MFAVLGMFFNGLLVLWQLDWQDRAAYANAWWHKISSILAHHNPHLIALLWVVCCLVGLSLRNDVFMQWLNGLSWQGQQGHARAGGEPVAAHAVNHSAASSGRQQEEQQQPRAQQVSRLQKGKGRGRKVQQQQHAADMSARRCRSSSSSNSNRSSNNVGKTSPAPSTEPKQGGSSSANAELAEQAASCSRLNTATVVDVDKALRAGVHARAAEVDQRLQQQDQPSFVQEANSTSDRTNGAGSSLGGDEVWATSEAKHGTAWHDPAQLSAADAAFPLQQLVRTTSSVSNSSGCASVCGSSSSRTADAEVVLGPAFSPKLLTDLSLAADWKQADEHATTGMW